MTSLDSIVEQLVDIYYREEWWQSHSMTREQAIRYHRKMIETGNLVYYEEDGKVLGYYEAWKLNYEQFGRIICHERFTADGEDVQSGNICYLANVWIDKNYRNSGVFKVLMHIFYRQNYHCEYYVGEALRKKHSPVKVFKRADLKSRLFKEGF